ncbi:hypothetical protein [Acetobacter sp. UBA5411]|uniref:hypothetical protein n=1 Tax=Acetobacter sp. UBA5411 TaxID=1945905 RepID=UPI0025BF8B2C|nr:hypothetical protein [Acetobacter sp. UBA5411]
MADNNESTLPKKKIKTCGIVMPISAMEPNYTAEHWLRVKNILWKAVEKAQMLPVLVWENPSVDVIQNTILKNIYESDLVICDVSGLNPNVMLETGLRLSTKKPTIIITDRVVKPPFDLQSIGHLHYQRDLEFNAIEEFLGDLSKKLIDVSLAEDDGTYTPFAEKFEIKTVTPRTVSLTSEDFILESIAEINNSISIIRKELSAQNYKMKNENFKKVPEEKGYLIRISSENKDLSPDLFVSNIPMKMISNMVVSSIEVVDRKEFIIHTDKNPAPYLEYIDGLAMNIYNDDNIKIEIGRE